MNPRWCFRNGKLWFILIQGCCLDLTPLAAGELLVTPKPAGAEVRWQPPAAGLGSPTELRLQRSTDLRRWENVGAKQRLPIACWLATRLATAASTAS